MNRPVAYEGNEPYIFVSYAHKDAHIVLPIISALQAEGFRVWYDAGIEAGTEWPEYIAEHLEKCNVFLAMFSQSAMDSVNCRQEINFAIDLQKEHLVVYLEDVKMTAGMRMRLGMMQAMFRHRSPDEQTFLNELCRSRVLNACRGNANATPAPAKTTPAPAKTTPAPAKTTPVPVKPATASQDFEINNGVLMKYVGKGGNVKVPDGVTVIGNRAFYGCTDVTSIRLPDGVKEIGIQAFHRCTSLTDIQIPQSVTTIGFSAFSFCIRLTNVYIPDHVTSLGTMLFYGCTRIKSVSVPHGLDTSSLDLPKKVLIRR